MIENNVVNKLVEQVTFASLEDHVEPESRRPYGLLSIDREATSAFVKIESGKGATGSYYLYTRTDRVIVLRGDGPRWYVAAEQMETVRAWCDNTNNIIRLKQIREALMYFSKKQQEQAAPPSTNLCDYMNLWKCSQGLKSMVGATTLAMDPHEAWEACSQATQCALIAAICRVDKNRFWPGLPKEVLQKIRDLDSLAKETGGKLTYDLCQALGKFNPFPKEN